jgi:hypothetical protein
MAQKRIRTKPNNDNGLLWLYEPLERESRFVCRKFFMLDAGYIAGKLYLALCDRDEPWNGLMVCTFHEHHDSLLAEFPQLSPHPILGKWLYISQSHPEFESVARGIVELVENLDRRLGVEPQKRKKKPTKHQG